LIEVHLYGKLRRFSDNLDPTQDSIVNLPVEEGDTIEDIIKRIGIPMEELGSNIFLNGEYSELERRVKAGDRLGIFPDNMQLLYKWYFRKKG
jgi:molybdopterin converting factor small subunit